MEKFIQYVILIKDVYITVVVSVFTWYFLLILIVGGNISVSIRWENISKLYNTLRNLF